MKKSLIAHCSFLILTFTWALPAMVIGQQITPSVWMSAGSVGTMSNGNQYSWSMGESFTATLPSSTLTFTQGFQQLFNVLGCTDPAAFNYNLLANVNDGSCVPFIYGCMDIAANNYGPLVNTDDGSCNYDVLGCTNYYAINFNPIATIDDGSCIIYGCMNPSAINFWAIANVDDGTCIILGCTSITAVNFNPLANSDDGTCIIYGCMDITADNYNPVATWPDFCAYNGCTDPMASNWDPTANIDDGSCIIYGCTDPSANNWSYYANFDDGSCTYDYLGCMDNFAVNYSPIATIDDGSCLYAGCTNPAAYNFNPSADVDDGSCIIYGCMDGSAINYNPSANMDDGSCLIYGCTDNMASNYNPLANNPDGSCVYLGCTDPMAANWSSIANVDDGSCYYWGCTNPLASNYNPMATNDDGSCVIMGCTSSTASNYNPQANFEDGSCVYVVYGCTDITALNYNPVANTDDGTCIPYIYGCTDFTALNYNPVANTDDGTCIPVILGCTNSFACNYLITANTDDGSCILPQPEICNGIDDNCDGVIDEGVLLVFYVDLDLDGYGNSQNSMSACLAPTGYVSVGEDCDDNNATLSPGAVEVCNSQDDNCSGMADEGLTFVNYYNDNDGDGFGAGASTNACQSPGANYVTVGGDCSANNGTIFPGAMEICGDGVDQDCLGGDLSCGGTSPDDANAVLNIGQFGTGVQSNNSVNFINANSSVQSPGTGLDKWYQFTAVTNAVRIGYKGSTSVEDDNRLMLFNGGQPINSTWVPLTTEDNVHPGALGASTDGGNETILYDDLVVGNQYFVCVQNTNTTPGTGSMTVSWLYGSKGDIGPYTNYTYSYNTVCQNFKAQFRPNGKFYTVKRWASAAAAGVPDWTYTIPIMNSTVCQLGKILSPNLTSTPQQKYVTVDVLYKLPNAFGTIVDVNATGTVVTTIGLNGEGPLLVRTSDACPIYKSTTGTIATNRSVCGTSYYNWRFDLVYPTTGLPIILNGAMGASRIMPLANVSGIANGQRYDVQIKPVHIDNLNQTGYSGVSCIRTLGAAGMVAEEVAMQAVSSNSTGWILYPNPVRSVDGNVQLQIAGWKGGDVADVIIRNSLGQVLIQSQYNAHGGNIQLDWECPSPGVYFVSLQGETVRWVVM